MTSEAGIIFFSVTANIRVRRIMKLKVEFNETLFYSLMMVHMATYIQTEDSYARQRPMATCCLKT